MDREHRTVIGIDPGLDGAIALLRRDEAPRIWDMPTVKLEKTGGGTKRDYELKTLCRIFEEATGLKMLEDGDTSQLIVIERLHPLPVFGPPDQPIPKAVAMRGSISAFSVGRSMGIIEMAAQAIGVPFIRVLPTVWKRRFSLLGQGKNASRVRAMERFPTVDLSKKKHDGRADALWLALYGMEVER